LEIMLCCVAIFLPIIIAYTAMVYRIMRGPVTAQSITRDSKTVYWKDPAMWYFAWILGLGFACLLAVLNAMWLEFKQSYNPWSPSKYAAEKAGTLAS
jgi:cyd operon protein YbgT